MANKQTRWLKNQIRKASKKGISEITIQIPVKTYHSDAKMISRTIPCTVLGKDGVNSKNERRNTCQKVYKNTGGSTTFHEPLNPDIPVYHKNHEYIDSYKQNEKFKSK